MAYYDALIAAWNSATQPPSGVTGTPLTGGMTTQQKVTAVNGWTRIGTAIPMIIETYKVYNLIVRSEFDALTAPQQQSVRDILGMGTVDASPGTNIRARMIQVFPNGTQTFTNLSNLANSFDSPVVNWCGFNGYPTRNGTSGNLSTSDATNAGLV